MNYIGFTVAGRFNCRVLKLNEDNREVTVRETGWFPNLITNRGLDMIGGIEPSGINYCLIGTNNTAPSVTQSALIGFVAYTQSAGGPANSYGGNLGAPDYISWHVQKYRFDQGAVVGNMAEIGVGAAPLNQDLWSRALIVDGSGNPTTITVLADEILEVTYEIRLYPDLVDRTASVTISGTTYNTVTRPHSLADADRWGNWVPGTMQPLHSFNTPIDLFVRQRALAAYTDFPSGNPSASDAPVPTLSTYISGNYYRDLVITAGLDQFNIAGGFSLLGFAVTLGRFQCSFSPNVPKDANKLLSLTFRIYWNRHTPP